MNCLYVIRIHIVCANFRGPQPSLNTLLLQLSNTIRRPPRSFIGISRQPRCRPILSSQRSVRPYANITGREDGRRDIHWTAATSDDVDDLAPVQATRAGLLRSLGAAAVRGFVVRFTPVSAPRLTDDSTATERPVTGSRRTKHWARKRRRQRIRFRRTPGRATGMCRPDRRLRLGTDSDDVSADLSWIDRSSDVRLIFKVCKITRDITCWFFYNLYIPGRQ